MRYITKFFRKKKTHFYTNLNLTYQKKTEIDSLLKVVFTR